MTARELAQNPAHPLHKTFVNWVKSKNNVCAQPNLRQARKFLQAFPQYREAKAA